MSKKRTLAVLSAIAIGTCVMSGVMAKPFKSFADEQPKVYSNYFDYDENELTLTEDFTSNKVSDGKSGVLISSVKSGNEAEGVSFTYKGVLSGTFETEFRVLSEKSYQGADDLTYTHGVNGWDTSKPSQSATLYAADSFNPYMDLKEVAFKFTSNTNSNAWFIVYVRGGYSANRADLSSARVFTSTDNADFSMGFTDSLDGIALKGYGLVGNDGWPSASWATTNGAEYTMMDGAFSNTVVNGTSATSMFKFNPETMQVYQNESWQLIRDLSSNAKVASGYQSNFGTLSASDFAGGYTVSVEFTDVTANTTVAGDISGVTTWGDFGYGEANAQYNTFDTAYDRYANMLVYGIKEGDVALSMDSSLIVDSSAFSGNAYAYANKDFKAEVGQTVDVTPVVKDVKLGDIAYSGTVTWTNLTDNTNGIVEAVEGKYNLIPATCGKYLVNYGAMSPYTSAFAVTFEAYAYGDLVGAKQTTCTEDGNIAYYYCEACDKYYDENKNEVAFENIVISALGHSWVDADCDTPKTCSVCPATEGEALGHSYGDWVITEEPTATEAGTKEKTCGGCGDVVTETIPALGVEDGSSSDKSTSDVPSSESAADNNPQSSAGGCGSVVGGIGLSMALLTVAGPAVLKKKED